MMEINILLNSVDKVKRFASVVAGCGAECEIVKGYNIIDAKSIMGIFSLDLEQPVSLRIHSDNAEILTKLKEWMVE